MQACSKKVEQDAAVEGEFMIVVLTRTKYACAGDTQVWDTFWSTVGMAAECIQPSAAN